MKNKYFIGLLVIAGSILSLASCEKDPSGISKSGSIPFVVSSGSPQTKTEYSGDGEWEGEGQNRRLVWERINWKEGEDQILIWSDVAMNDVGEESHQAIYVVGAPTVTGENKISRAPVQKKATDELFFQEGESTYTFWGYYPANSGEDLANDTKGAIKFTVPAEQSYDGSTTADGVTTLGPDMDNAFMLAKVDYTTDDELVELPFYPAFTAFEFTLVGGASEVPLKSIVLSADSPLSGDVNATLDDGTRTNSKGKVVGKSTYTFDTEASASTNTITFAFPDNTVVSENNALTFTVFALPRDITNLTLELHMGENGEDVRKGVLKQSGNALTFGECEKHRIKGILVEGNYEFSVLNFDFTTLWEDVSSKDYPQSTQFQVSGDVDNIYNDLGGDKSLRQCWVFNSADGVATVTFKVMLPAGGSYRIVPDGDTSAFLVNNASPSEISGNIGNDGTTRVTFTVKPAEGKYGDGNPYLMHFKTYVTNAAGEEFSLDSETQLYDMRGYHYFILNTTEPEI